MYLPLLLLTLVTVAFPVFANVQDYRYRKAFNVQRLSIDQGLSQSVVQDIIQDEYGYIWIATEDGLNRFDSYEFKVYRHDHRNQHSLHDNWVLSLAEEPGKGIWVGTFSGLTFLDHKTQRFKNYSDNNKKLRSKIQNIVRLENGDVYAASENGLFVLDRERDQFELYTSSNGQKITGDTQSIVETDEYLYVSSLDCLIRIDREKNTVFNMCDLNSLSSVKRKNISQVVVQDNSIWIATNNGLFLYDVKRDSLTSYFNRPDDVSSISSNYVQDILIDNHGALWIATVAGLDYFNQSKNVFEHYTQEYNFDEGLSAKDVQTLWFDKEQLLWLGTYSGGVNVLNPSQHKFEHILTKKDVASLGQNNTIHGLVKDKNQTLWIASFGGGLLNYNLLSGEITKPMVRSNKDLNDFIYALHVDFENRLWVASYKELTIVDPVLKVEYKTNLVVDGIRTKDLDKVKHIHQDHLGQIFIGSDIGLYKVLSNELIDDVYNIELINLSAKLPKSFTNHNQSILSIIDDRDGNYWFGGAAGVVYYEVDKDKWTHFNYEQNNPQSLSSNNVQVIHEDSQGFIWVGTDDGLNRVIRSDIDPSTFYFQRITTYEGLPNNSIYGILEDDQQSLWLSTSLGIVKYANGQVTSDSFRKNDGLSSNEFNTKGYYSDSNGRLYFGSINGITVINNVDSKNKTTDGTISFTHLKIGDRDLDVFNINEELNPTVKQYSNEAAIDVAVASISYSKLGTQRYRYRIKELNNKWNYLGVRRNMFIAGLPEGKFTLEVQVQLSGLDWSNKIRTLNIHVEKDFWSSSQAYYLIGFVLLLVFISVFFLIVRYYKGLVSRSARKTKLESLRVKELRADNDSLTAELSEKDLSIQELNRKIEVEKRKLSVDNYRDVSSGFYRLNYFYKLETDDFLDEETNLGKGVEFYKTMAIIELTDFSSIYKKQGPLAAAEIESQASITIRQNSDSGIQIFQVLSGVYLILSNTENYQLFEDNMINLRYQLLRSEFSISNGLSENSDIALTLFKLQNLAFTSKRQLDVTIDLLNQVHLQLTIKDSRQCHRVIKKQYLDPKLLNTNTWQLEGLIENQVIEIQNL